MAIALGYEDLNDHDQLRRDPALATLAGKLTAWRKNCEPLAGKSTLNRLEHAPETRDRARYHKISHDPAAFETLFVDCFILKTSVTPRHLHDLTAGGGVRWPDGREGALAMITVTYPD